MKTLLLILLLVPIMSFGQAPESFNYQAVVRDAGGIILNNQPVGMRLTVQQGSIGGTAVYTETFTSTTNGYGLVNLEIGTGTSTDDFSTIDWANGPYFMETAVDFLGGVTWVVMGTSQLMSVPYALYAKTSGNGEGPAGADGIDGVDGQDGIDGIDGIDGAQGPQGLTGPAGDDGIDGQDGAQGIQGLTGATGQQGATGNNGDVGDAGLQGPIGPAGNDGQGGVTTAGTNVTITGTGTSGNPYVVNAADNVDDADNDSSNEIQSLSVNSDSLMISGGNSVSINSIVNSNPCPSSITVPDGICQAQIISNSNVNGSTYTVPANKNLYLNRLFYSRKGSNPPRYAQIYINGALVFNENDSEVKCGVALLDDNVILPPGSTVTATVTSQGGWGCYTTLAENNVAVIDGFLVDKKVDALFLTSNYTVPASKYFIQTNSTLSTPAMYSSGSNVIATPTLYVSGYLVDN